MAAIDDDYDYDDDDDDDNGDGFSSPLEFGA